MVKSDRASRPAARGRASACILSLFAVAPVLHAADRGEECTRIKADRERLACFDTAFRVPQAIASQAVAPVAAGAAVTPTAAAPAAAPVAAPAPPAARSEDFGLNEAQKQKKAPPAEAPRIDEITSTVAAAEKNANGAWRISLANGQVWLQSADMGKSVSIRPGDAVTISRGTMGSFFLETPSGRGLRVKRVN